MPLMNTISKAELIKRMNEREQREYPANVRNHYKMADVRIKHTPNCRHKYTATPKNCGTYGFGNTPDEARASLLRQLTERL